MSNQTLFISAISNKTQTELIPLVETTSENKKSNSTENVVQDDSIITNNRSDNVAEVVNDNNDMINNAPKNVLTSDHQINSDKLHYIIGWKHDLGSLFSKKIKLFYGVDSVSTLPCASFNEWLNLKQFCFFLIDHHLSQINFVFNFLNFSGIKEEFIDDKYDRIALQTSSFYRLLKQNPNAGFFYFPNENLKNFYTVNISFCNCQVAGYSLFDLISEILQFTDFDLDTFQKHLFSYCQHLKENINHETSTEEIDISVKQFTDLIIQNSDIDELEQNLLFRLIQNLSKTFIPKNFTFHQHVDKNKIKPLREMCLVLSHSNVHKTVGFVLKIEKNKIEKDALNNFYLCFYEIFKESDDNQDKLRLVDKVLLLDKEKNEHICFHHLMINVAQNKKSFFKKKIFFNNNLN
ncbi:MAG: hypothetical protein Q8888_02205 [Vigna little leaf phytoplasma]|nr:hypothetical protein [Vigna little leaf phytoplasma]